MPSKTPASRAAALKTVAEKKLTSKQRRAGPRLKVKAVAVNRRATEARAQAATEPSSQALAQRLARERALAQRWRELAEQAGVQLRELLGVHRAVLQQAKALAELLRVREGGEQRPAKRATRPKPQTAKKPRKQQKH
jgi:hypothetical protein